MTYQIRLEWQVGENRAKLTAFVQAGDMDQAVKLATEKVGTRVGSHVSAVRAAEVKMSMMFMLDGAKPVFLSMDQAADAPGQTRIPAADREVDSVTISAGGRTVTTTPEEMRRATAAIRSGRSSFAS